jgi:hypothetical protein
MSAACAAVRVGTCHSAACRACFAVWVCRPACVHGRGAYVSVFVPVPISVRLVSTQRCSPARNRRFARPSARSAYTYTPSGPSPAQLAWFSRVPPRWRRRNKPRLHFCGSSSPVSGPRPRSRSPRRRSRSLHPPSAAQCVVGGIPPPSLACIRRRSARTASSRVAQLGTRPLARLPHQRFALMHFFSRASRNFWKWRELPTPQTAPLHVLQ